MKFYLTLISILITYSILFCICYYQLYVRIFQSIFSLICLALIILNKNKISHLLDEEVVNPPHIKYDPWKLKNALKYNWKLIYLGAMLLMPWRILLFLISFTLILIIFQLLKLLRINHSNQQYSPIENIILKIILLPLHRLLVFGMGISFGCTRIKGKIDKKCPILVNNHSSQFDYMLLGAYYNPVWIMSIDQKSPKLLLMLGRAVKMLTVNRNGRSSREKCLEEIKNRISLFNDNLNSWSKIVPPLNIFPEGAMTNGDFLLAFRKGAFITKSKIQPYYIKQHDCPITKLHGDSGLLPMEQLLLNLCSFYLTVDIVFMKTINPTEHNFTDEIDYSDYVRMKIINGGNFKKADNELSQKDGNEFEKQIKNKHQKNLTKND